LTHLRHGRHRIAAPQNEFGPLFRPSHFPDLTWSSLATRALHSDDITPIQRTVETQARRVEERKDAALTQWLSHNKGPDEWSGPLTTIFEAVAQLAACFGHTGPWSPAFTMPMPL
jgi:hypothetical protein